MAFIFSIIVRMVIFILLVICISTYRRSDGVDGVDDRVVAHPLNTGDNYTHTYTYIDNGNYNDIGRLSGYRYAKDKYIDTYNYKDECLGITVRIYSINYGYTGDPTASTASTSEWGAPHHPNTIRMCPHKIMIKIQILIITRLIMITVLRIRGFMIMHIPMTIYIYNYGVAGPNASANPARRLAGCYPIPQRRRRRRLKGGRNPPKHKNIFKSICIITMITWFILVRLFQW